MEEKFFNIEYKLELELQQAIDLEILSDLFFDDYCTMVESEIRNWKINDILSDNNKIKIDMESIILDVVELAKYDYDFFDNHLLRKKLQDKLMDKYI